MFTRDTDTIDKRMKADDRIIKVFLALLVINIILSSIGIFSENRIDLIDFLNNFINGISLVFFITGVLSAHYYWQRRFFKFRKILIYILIISVIFSAVTFLYFKFFSGGFDVNILSVDVTNELLILISLMISLPIALIISSFFITLMGFGAVGVMSAVMRKHLPGTFEDIERISEELHERTEDEHTFRHLYYLVLKWFFSIPYVLDTSSFSIRSSNITRKFSIREYKKAILWELFFCIIISINISLNPILLDYLSVSELFAFTSGVAIFIPIIILPWFIYHVLEAEIEGITKNFSLYHGIRNRIFGVLVAIGTLITFVRLGLKEVSLEILLINFITYLTGTIFLILLFTFVYFNYFEEDLVKDIYERYNSSG